jgi:FKBP-type peptidyl-prolyl cis-trans isomerase FkpA
MSRHVPVSGIYQLAAYARSAGVLAALATLAWGASIAPPAIAQTGVPPDTTQGASKLDATPKELQRIDVKQGTGADAVTGKVVVVHYTGWLYDPAKPDNKGKKFDSSRDAGKPFDFPLGGGRVIKGWDQGVVGMKVGGQRTLVIPPDLGYGARGFPGAIPPNAVLIFDVELLEVK